MNLSDKCFYIISQTCASIALTFLIIKLTLLFLPLTTFGIVAFSCLVYVATLRYTSEQHKISLSNYNVTKRSIFEFTLYMLSIVVSFSLLFLSILCSSFILTLPTSMISGFYFGYYFELYAMKKRYRHFLQFPFVIICTLVLGVAIGGGLSMLLTTTNITTNILIGMIPGIISMIPRLLSNIEIITKRPILIDIIHRLELIRAELAATGIENSTNTIHTPIADARIIGPSQNITEPLIATANPL